MREGVFAGAEVVIFAEADELVLGFWVERGIGPFALGFEEEGEGVGADVDGVCDGVLYT